MPTSAPAPIGADVQISEKYLAYWMLMLFRQAATENPKHPAVRSLIRAAKLRDPRFEVATLGPWDISNLVNIHEIFGSTDAVINALEATGTISPEQKVTLESEVDKRKDIILASIQTAAPVREDLEESQVSDRYIDNKTYERLETIEEQRKIVREELEGAALKTELQRLERLEQEVRQGLDSILYQGYEKKDGKRIYYREEKERLEQQKFELQDRIAATRDTEQKKILQEKLEKVEDNLQTLTDQLVSKKVSTSKSLDSTLPLLGREAQKERQRLKKSKEYQLAETRAKEILSAVRLRQEGVETLPRRDLRGFIDTPPVTRGGLEEVEESSEVASYARNLNPGKVEREALAIADARRTMERDARRVIEESIEFELQQAGESSADLRERISREIADEFAADFAQYAQEAADAGYGARANTLLPLYLTQNEGLNRTKITHAILQATKRLGTTAAREKATAYVDRCMAALKEDAAPRTPVVDIEYKSTSEGLKREETTYRPYDDRIIQGRTTTLIKPSVEAEARRILDTYKVEMNRSVGESEPYDRQRRVMQQVAFADGVMEMKKEIEGRPERALMGAQALGTKIPFTQIPAGPIVAYTPEMAWALAPKRLKEAGTTVRGNLLSIIGLPFLGSIPAGTPLLGGIPASFLLGNAAAYKLRQEEFEKNWNVPFFHTRQWVEGYSRGHIVNFAQKVLPVGQIASTDGKGNIVYGVHLLPTLWNNAHRIAASGLDGLYNRTFESVVNSVKGDFGKANEIMSKKWGMTFVKNLAGRYKKDKDGSPLASLLIMRPVLSIGIAAGSTFLEHTGIAARVKSTVNKITPNFIKGAGAGRLAAAWNGTKIGLEGALRLGTVAGVSFLMGNSLPAALGIGTAYAVPWTVRKVMTTPFFAGQFSWDAAGSKIVPSYKPGYFYQHDHKFLAKLSEAWNAPLTEIGDIKGLSRAWKNVARVGRLFPWDGVWAGALLYSLGIHSPLAFIAPITLDLTVRSLRELGKFQRFYKYVLSPTSFFSKLSGGLNTLFSVGALSFALDTGGLFDVFSHFNVQNLAKFMSLPGTFFSYMGLTSAFPSLLVFGLGAPAAIAAPVAAAVMTGLTVGADILLRSFGVPHGLWTPFKWLLKQFGGFLKDKGWAFASGALGIVAGLFGIFSSAFRGDTRGVVTGFLLMGGGIFVATTFTAVVYTPTVASLQAATSNLFIRSTQKKSNKVNANTMAYKYSFKLNLNDKIDSLTLKEQDFFSNITYSDISNIETLTKGPKITRELQQGRPLLTRTATYTPESPDPEINFNVVFSEPISDLIARNKIEDEGICNTLTLKIADIKGTDEIVKKAKEQNFIRSEICIDKNGNRIFKLGDLQTLPLEVGEGNATITSCYGLRSFPSLGFHYAIDISATSGTPVHAAGDGTVDYAGWSEEGYGNLVIIDHETKFTYYGHLLSTNTEVGNKVNAGDTIGEVGSTGNSTGPHLHFETRNSEENYYNPCCESTLNLCNSYPGPQCAVNNCTNMP